MASLAAPELLVFIALLAALAWEDARSGLLPHRLTLPGVAAGLAFAAALHGFPAFAGRLAAAAGVWVLFLLGWLASHGRGVGGGDAWMAAMIGAFLGAAALPALALGLGLGLVCGFAWALGRRLPLRAASIRLGPFLAAGAIAAALAAA